MNQQTAQGLASLGRGPDSMLVHMAPQEVAGLQALAMKHGGSLTINPETGLPEAGFLSSILPMVLGAGLAATGIGAPMAAMLVGGGYGVAKGSLKEGLMAGLGAYGGAGLGAGLMGAAPAAAATPAAVTSPAAMPVPNFTPVASAPLATSVAAGTPLGFNPAFDPTVAKFITPDTLFPSTLTPPPPINIGATPPSFERMGAGLKDVFSSGDKALAFAKENAYPLGAVGLSALAGMQPKSLKASPQDQGMIRPYTYSREKVPSAFQDVAGEPLSSKERRYFTDQYTALAPYKAPGPEYMAVGGPVEAMSNGNNLAAYMGQDKFAEGGSIGGYAFDPRTGLYTKPSGEGATTVSPTGGVSRASGEGDGDPFSYINPNVAKETFEEQSARNQELNNLLTNLSTVLSPGATILSGLLSTPFAGAIANAFGGTQDASKADVVNMGTSIPEVAGNFVAEQPGSPDPNNAAPGGFDSDYMAQGGLAALAQGGMSNLGDYSDGGRLLRGPGDGVSDDIPAMIGQKQQARLADGEFVVPARIVSELGNGSTEAGARQLYAMMDRVQKARKKSIGKDKVATDSRAAKLLPA